MTLMATASARVVWVCPGWRVPSRFIRVYVPPPRSRGRPERIELSPLRFNLHPHSLPVFGHPVQDQLSFRSR